MKRRRDVLNEQGMRDYRIPDHMAKPNLVKLLGPDPTESLLRVFEQIDKMRKQPTVSAPY